jgi:hypothetical protein
VFAAFAAQHAVVPGAVSTRALVLLRDLKISGRIREVRGGTPGHVPSGVQNV